MRNIILTFLFLIISLFLFSCSNKEKVPQNKTMQKMDTRMQEQPNKMKDVQSEMIRKGEIDVASIDKNGDGKVFECPMDWNVISDQPGECPVCGMHLKEFSIAETESNLEKYGYKVKSTGK